MAQKKELSPIEIKLLKEQAISEYIRKQESRSYSFNSFFRKLKILTPLNIIVGIIASIFLVMMTSWDELIKVLLTAIIWLTLVSTALSGMTKGR